MPYLSRYKLKRLYISRVEYLPNTFLGHEVSSSTCHLRPISAPTLSRTGVQFYEQASRIEPLDILSSLSLIYEVKNKTKSAGIFTIYKYIFE